MLKRSQKRTRKSTRRREFTWCAVGYSVLCTTDYTHFTVRLHPGFNAILRLESLLSISQPPKLGLRWTKLLPPCSTFFETYPSLTSTPPCPGKTGHYQINSCFQQSLHCFDCRTTTRILSSKPFPRFSSLSLKLSRTSPVLRVSCSLSMLPRPSNGSSLRYLDSALPCRPWTLPRH